MCSAAILSGCWSPVTITSEPSGARVWIDGVERGVTPVTTEVHWSGTRRNTIVLEHPDCHRFSTTLQRTLRLPEVNSDGAEVLRAFGVTYLTICTFGLGLVLLRGPVEDQHFVLAPRSARPDGDASPHDVEHPDARPREAGDGESSYPRGGER
jgi:hypothetical protein